MRDAFSDIVPFVHVAREGSFRAAAARLGVTPAAVSKAIGRLERELGVVLFHRTTRTVRLSAEGERLLERSAQALRWVEDARAEAAAAQRDVRGDVVVSMSPVMRDVVLARLGASGWLARHPDVRLCFQVTDRMARMVEDGIDVAVRIGPLADAAMIARRVGVAAWALVASPRYLAERGTPQTPEALSEHVAACFRGPAGVLNDRWAFRDPDSARPRPVRVPCVFEADDGWALVRAAQAGLGVSLCFRFMVEDALRDGRLVELLGDYAPEGLPIHALWLPSRQDVPKVRAFVAFLLQALGGA